MTKKISYYLLSALLLFTSCVAITSTAFAEGCVGTICLQPDRDQDGIPDAYDDCPDDPDNNCFCDDWNNGLDGSVAVVLAYYGVVGIFSPVHAGIAIIGGIIATGITIAC